MGFFTQGCALGYLGAAFQAWCITAIRSAAWPRFVAIVGGDLDWSPPEYYIAELERFFDELTTVETSAN